MLAIRIGQREINLSVNGFARSIILAGVTDYA